MNIADKYINEVVSMPSQITQKLAAHEVMLSFREDDDAYAFSDWWEVEGKYKFGEFLMSHNGWGGE